MSIFIVYFCIIPLTAGLDWEKFEFINGTFSSDFIWAAATSSYQIEGGWNADGKGLGLWDSITHLQPSHIAGNATGDVACDSYHKWKDDINQLKLLNVSHYRFSISWPRILPTGFLKDGVNKKGVAYYMSLIDGLRQNNIQPMVTMFHWDLPQNLIQYGAYINDSFVDWFEDYATLLFKLYGHKVKHWITFNEPMSFAVGVNYHDYEYMPNCPATCPYIATTNVMKSHARVWHVYDKKFRKKMKGKVGITLNCNYFIPGTNNSKDVEAVERYYEFFAGIFLNPIFINGDWPEVVKKTVAKRSKEQGYKNSRLPAYSVADRRMLKGAVDFFGLNVYSANFIYDFYEYTDKHNASFYNDFGIYSNVSADWPSSGSGWLKFTPFAPRGALNWVKERYGNIEVIITECGWSDHTGTTHDPMRAKFFNQYINSALQAYLLDGVNIKGFTAWSLMDNFEWHSGFTEKFGLFSVNFTNPDRPRIPKTSVSTYSKIIRNNGFPTETNRIVYI